MKNIYFIFFVLVSFSNYAQNFERNWEKVISFEQKGSIKSAFEVVNKIYKKAKRKNTDIEIIKTFFFRAKYMQVLEEDAQTKIIENLRNDIKEVSQPSQALLEYIYAKCLLDYLQRNKYKIKRRTETENILNKNFLTWTTSDFETEIGKLDEKLIANKKILQNKKLQDYELILEFEKLENIKDENLYNFLLKKYISLYKNQIERWENRDKFFTNLENEIYSETDNFLKIKFDSVSDYYLKRIAQLFHELEKTNPNNQNLQLQRMQFFEEYVFRNKDNFLAVLNKFQQKIKDTSLAKQVQLDRAELYNNLAVKKIRPSYKNTAVSILDSILSEKSRSNIYKNAYKIKQEILSKKISVRIQQYVYDGENTRAFIEFQNTDSLFINIFKIKEDYDFSNGWRSNDSIIESLFEKSKFQKLLQFELPKQDDYYEHTTEVLIPKLEKGNYLFVFAAEKARFQKTEKYDFKVIKVTDLAIVKNQEQNKDILTVLNRKTGQPIENVTVQMNDLKTNSDKYGKAEFTRPVKSKNQNYYNNVTVQYGIDTLKTQFYKYYYNTDDAETEDEAFFGDVKFYLDRAIYRPGQKVYGKGIVIQKKAGVKSVVPNVTVLIYVEDAKNNEILEKEYKSNEFGSFTFDFVIPKNGITGQFSIEADEPDIYENDIYYNADTDEHSFWDYVDFNYSTIDFSVEEYKKPTFKIEFDEITENYQVYDTISVTGKAISFSGVNLSDSKVSYRIERKSYPNYYSRYSPSENLQIYQSETTTDGSGNYKIDFKATPSLEMDKKDLPIFEYIITADVTDIRGETQTTETSVNVGYHSLSLDVTMPNIVNTQNENTIQLSSKNLNGKFLATKGSLKIYYKEPLNSKFKKRIFSKPDIPGFTDEEFEKLFPYEDNYNVDYTNGLGSIIYSKEVNTDFENKINLNFLKNEKSGKYTVIFAATDAFNNHIENTTNFILLHDATNQNNKIITFKTLNINPFEDGFADIEIWSDIKMLFVTISSDESFNFKNDLFLKNGKAKVKVPINKDRTEDINLKFETYFENEYFTESYTIDKSAISDLQIIVNSFRNKIEPGSDQNWNFTINNKTQTAEAEALVSMYDSSLDQFETKNWDGLNIRDNYYNNYNRSENLTNNITYTSLNRLNTPLPRFRYTNNNIDLFWFGFDFVNPKSKDFFLNSNKIISKIPEDATIAFGIITDDSGLPLPGANVIVRGTSRGTQTDFDGYYSIEVGQDEILDISYVGFDSKSIKANTGENDVSLDPGSSLNEVVITGYSQRNKTVQTSAVISIENDSVFYNLNGKAAGVQITAANGKPGQGFFVRIRGSGSINAGSSIPLYIVDGKAINQDDSNNGEVFLAGINNDDILDITILKDAASTARYGSRGINGVIIITTKKSLEALQIVQTRKNFNETAFFYPQLKTDKKGQVSFNFISPESLTQWKLRLLAHNKNTLSGYLEKIVITQKELMIAPNMPRFFREKDTIQLSARISNLTSESKTGTAILQLFDAVTMQAIDIETNNQNNIKTFIVNPNGNTVVYWKISVPQGLQGLQYKVVAKAGDFSDGEENIIPVLTNSIIVTESKPIWIRGNTEKDFTLENLKYNTSTTLKNHQIILEYTSNPTWLAIEALPYLMEYEHECSEQTFARYYANAIATQILDNNPKIAAHFQNINEANTTSNLEENEELKSIILSETPWFNDALSEKEKQERMAVLFNLQKMKEAQQNTYDKLSQKQLPSGAFPWFEGGSENEYITRHIIAGLGKLGLKSDSISASFEEITTSGIKYLDRKFQERNKPELEKNKNLKELGYSDIHYLYVRSLYLKSHPILDSLQLKINNALDILKENWLTSTLYEKGLTALAFNRFGYDETAKKIINNLKETASNNEDWGMYWIENKQSWHWYQAPIETQAILISAFAEVENDKKSVEAMKVWLLKNKQVKSWSSTKSTSEAIDAFLLYGKDWTDVQDKTTFKLGNYNVLKNKLAESKDESETGYVKVSLKPIEISKDMATLSIKNNNNAPGYGGFYWQYFEELDQIKNNTNTPLLALKELYIKENTDSGQQLTKVTSENPLKIGDLITIRLIVSTKEDMEFVHLKDMRASTFEPVDVLSEYKYKDGLSYYISTRDAATNFFFDRIDKGTYVLEYDVRVNNIGNFSNGITTIQSMYAPEFSSHSKGMRVKIID